MKSLILFLTIVFTCSAVAVEKNKTVTLSVTGMTCQSCASTVEKALKKVNGVKDARVNLTEKKATIIVANAKTSVAALIKAVSDAGFSASTKPDVEKKSESGECDEGCCDDGEKPDTKQPKKL